MANLLNTLEQELVDKLNLAVQQLQAAQTRFVDTMDALQQHNIHSDSHLDIRQRIIEIEVGSGFLTPSQGEQLVTNSITQHNTSSTSHQDIRALLSQIQNTLTQLDTRLRLLEPDDTSNMTELERRLKAVNDYYDPTLEALMQAWQAAAMQGLPTATAIANEYQNVLTQKAQAIADVLREFQYE